MPSPSSEGFRVYKKQDIVKYPVACLTTPFGSPMVFVMLRLRHFLCLFLFIADPEGETQHQAAANQRGKAHAVSKGKEAIPANMALDPDEINTQSSCRCNQDASDDSHDILNCFNTDVLFHKHSTIPCNPLYIVPRIGENSKC